MKRALVVRHVSHEGLAGFAEPVVAAGYEIEHVRAKAPEFRDIDLLAPDLVILMGGPMAVYEAAHHPWMADELKRLASRLAARLPTMGVCLGSQIIAAALGANVAPGPVREVGFAPIELTGIGRSSPLAVLEGVPLLHWHGDGFALPNGATLLAKTADYPQAFAIGSTILALQCHPEMGDAGDDIESWIRGSESYIESAGTTAGQVRSDYRQLGAAAVGAGRRMMAEWLSGL